MKILLILLILLKVL